MPTTISLIFGRQLRGAFFSVIAACGFVVASIAADADPKPSGGPRISPAPESAGQTVPDKDAVVELSPFHVSAEAETGYRATSTLAGTRLKTDLKDIGAAVSVVTDELMRDIGAVNAEDVLVYMPGTEVGGVSGNFLGSGLNQNGINDDGRANPTDNNRVRGLANLTNTRDYFVTSIPFNHYNSTALTLSRGPNAILAGAGSPGGVLDRSLKSAIFSDRHETTFRLGANGAHRETLDFNRVLLTNRLAARLVMLNENTEYNQRPATMADRRLFGALTWRAYAGRPDAVLGATTIRANYETGTIEGTPPNPIPPINGFESWWIDNKPRWNSLTNQATSPTGQVVTGGTRANAFFRNFAAFFNQPDAQTPLVGYTTPGFTNVQGMLGLTNAVPNSLVPVARSIQATQVLDSGLSDFARRRMTEADRAVFDFRENLLTGAYDSVRHQFHAHNIRLEQLFWGGKAGIELVVDEQYYGRRQNIPFSGVEAQIKIDITEVHPNGLANPNFGRPFMLTNDISPTQDLKGTNKAWRATAFLSHDFTQTRNWLGRLLGRHTLTGLATSTTVTQNTQALSSPWTTTDPTINLDSLLANPGLAVRNARALIYIGGSAAGLASASQMHLAPVTGRLPSPGNVVNISFFDPSRNAFRVEPLTIGQIVQSAGMTEERLRSQAVSLQSHWLDGHLITIAGWRRDDDTNFTAANPTVLNDGNVDLKTLFLPSTPASTNRADSPSYSVVGVLPRKLQALLPFDSKLRAYWNTSKNFTPSGQRRNSFNEEIGPPDAKTTEQGVMLTVFGGKLDLRLNWFKTIAANATDPAVRPMGALTGMYTIVNRLLAAQANGLSTRDWGYGSFASFADVAKAHFDAIPSRLRISDADNFTPRLIPIGNGNYLLESDTITNAASTTDYVAKGLELEAAVNVTTNWRITFNCVKAETVKSNVGIALRAYINEYMANLQRINPQVFTGSRNPGQVQNPWGEYFRTTQIVDLEIAERTAGSASPELVKWRWNLVNRYDFPARPLRGLYVGGALRWQDRAVIGYPYVTNSAGVQSVDLAHPHFSKIDFRGDAFMGFRGSRFFDRKLRWSVQLNVRNLIGDQSLIAATANPNGSPGVVRIPPEKTWFLTSTFQF